MKREGIRLAVLTLCCALLLGLCMPAVTARAEENNILAKLEESQEDIIYVLTQADGAWKKTLYSDGSEDAGTAARDALPINLTVSYQLDGKQVTPQALAGKSGKVTIRYEYENRKSSTVTLGGKQETLYTPYTVLTGMLLDSEKFRNVTVSNGKIMDDGSHTAVIGIAFPGLQENLGIDREDLELPGFVEITADVQDFSLDMTITLVSDALWNELDLDELDSLEDLTESVGKLTDAMDQLMGGSEELYTGLNTLLGKSGELVGGIDQLSAGAKSLRDGANALDEGALQLQSGAGQLSAGLNAIDTQSDSLRSAAGQVFNSLLSSASSQLANAGIDAPGLSIGNYSQVLAGVIDSLDETAVYNQALAAVTAAVEAQRDTIAAQVRATVQENIRQQVTAVFQGDITQQVTEAVYAQITAEVIQSAAGMDPASYAAAVEAGQIPEETQAAISAAIEEQKHSAATNQLISDTVAGKMASDEIQAAIEGKIAEQMTSEDVTALIEAETEHQIQKAIADQMSSDAVQSQLAAASQGAQAVIALKTSLDSYNTFYLGVQSYTAAVGQAAAGADELKTGIDSLKAGAGELSGGTAKLYSGILTLKSSTPALVDGVTKLRDGALKLSDGLSEFDEKGIQVLVDAVDGDVDGLLERLQAIYDMTQGQDSHPTYLYRTDSIG